MPDTQNYTEESEWMGACVPAKLAEGMEQEQAVAVCLAQWREKSQPDTAYFGGEVKALGNGRVGGYLVRYSTPADPDTATDYFDAKSEIHAPDTLPVLYHHGMDATIKRRILGSASVKRDDVGVWVEAQLAMRDEYEKEIYRMAKDGKLGWSSGALGYLVEREPVGKAWHIKSWFIGEASLTPTPAEPRNAAMLIKSLFHPVEIAAGEISQMENAKMETKADFSITGGTLSLEAVEAAVEAKLKQREAEAEAKAKREAEAKAKREAEVKAAEEAGYRKAIDELKSAGINAPAIKRITEPGFSEEKDAVPAFKHWLKTGQTNGGLIAPDASFSSIKAAHNVGNGGQGGYLVPDPLYNQIIAKRDIASWVRQAPVQRFTTPADHILVPVEDTAMTDFVLTAEAGSYDENEATFAQKDLVLYKYTKLVKASEEFVSYEGTNFDAWLSQALGRAEAGLENAAFTVGTGSGEPQGVLVGATSSGITTAAAAAITPAELSQLIGTLNGGWNVNGETGFLMQNATKWYLKGLTSSNFTFIGTPANGGGDFYGYPAYVSDDMEALAATKKAVLFGNFSGYGIVEKPGMIVQRNPYLYMATGQIGIFASIFRGGGVLQSTALYYMTQHS